MQGGSAHELIFVRVGRGYGPEWTLAVVVVSPALMGSVWLVKSPKSEHIFPPEGM